MDDVVSSEYETIYDIPGTTFVICHTRSSRLESYSQNFLEIQKYPSRCMCKGAKLPPRKISSHVDADGKPSRV